MQESGLQESLKIFEEIMQSQCIYLCGALKQNVSNMYQHLRTQISLCLAMSSMLLASPAERTPLGEMNLHS